MFCRVNKDTVSLRQYLTEGSVRAMSEVNRRKLGVLMHISSLPGKYGVGDFGDGAEDFADFLLEAGCTSWQVLPLVPVSGAFGYSPYSSPSAFAGNILFISPDKLVGIGLLSQSDLSGLELPASDRADFAGAYDIKKKILQLAYKNFRGGEAYKTKFKALSDEFWNFCVREAYWLEDYALFTVLKSSIDDVAWSEWPRECRMRDWSVLDPFKRKADIAKQLDMCRFEQFIFYRQLAELREMCRIRGIEVIGDMPIYVGYDSADVWGHQELFELDSDGRPTSVAGVPPDYFSETGQRWGNPLYNWDKMKSDGYEWWLGRFKHSLKSADVVRIDHFRGFMAYWSIPADEKTAINGKWRECVGRDLFFALRSALGRDDLPFIAEDLGVITDDVRAVMDEFALPGMKVMHFAFGADMAENPYIPHMHRRNSVVYAGTHDNNTTVGWWENDITPTEILNFCRYIDRPKLDSRGARDAMFRLAAGSTAERAIIAAQDILCLGEGARMNVPSVASGNWSWRIKDMDALRASAAEIRELSVMYGRFVEPEELCDSAESDLTDDLTDGGSLSK